MSTGAAGPSRVDHLVVVADTLEQGAAWCEATLGVCPGPGGRHPLMATHNRLLPIGGPAWPQAYLEIIAIDPAAETSPAGGRARWFGMDSGSLRAAVRARPQLVHFVAQTQSIQAARAALTALGEDVGEVVAAARDTPRGELRWQISLRRDGLPQHGGALPSLIEWAGAHPSDSMQPVGITLRSLVACSADSRALQRAHAAIGLQGVGLQDRPACGGALAARLSTPRGEVVLAGVGVFSASSGP